MIGVGILAVAVAAAPLPAAGANRAASVEQDVWRHRKPSADDVPKHRHRRLRKLAGTCPRTEPEPWSNCTDVGEVSCNLGKVYGGDEYCWKDCDGKVWTHVCARPPAGGTCPETRPVSWSACTEKVTCNLGEMYGGDNYCWLRCDGKEWMHYCAQPTPDKPPVNPCADAATCDDCLARPGCGAWARPGGCYSQCSYDQNDPGSLKIADGSCWDGDNGGCAAAQASADDWAICSAQTAKGCADCMKTDKSKGGGKCLWISFEMGVGGSCAPEQGMMGFPVDECPAEEAASCPKVVPESWSACTKKVTCNLGELYGGDKYCWLECDGNVWAEYCAQPTHNKPPANPCADAATCEECLDRDGCDGWAGKCFTTCEYDMEKTRSLHTADVPCYSSKNSGCGAMQTNTKRKQRTRYRQRRHRLRRGKHGMLTTTKNQ